MSPLQIPRLSKNLTPQGKSLVYHLFQTCFNEGHMSHSSLLNMLLNLNKVNKITFLAPMDSLGKL